MEREAELRKELDLAPQLRAQPPGDASAALLLRVRTTVLAYEDIARKYPRSGYSDNALWQAAVLSADAFWQFGDTRDRAVAVRLFNRLKAEFPTSSLVVRVASHTNRLNGAVSTSDGLATLKAIRREILPDAVRVTLELEREAMFYEERLENPARVFVDLKNTRTVDALKDATIAFEDDVVRQARIGRQPDNRTRIVFDLQGAGRYSVYSLYNPNRVVIDFERTKGTKETKGTKHRSRVYRRFRPAITPPHDCSTGDARLRPPPRKAPARFHPLRPRRMRAADTRCPGSWASGSRVSSSIRDMAATTRARKCAASTKRNSSSISPSGWNGCSLNEPGVEVVLTRRTNAYVALEERTAIANRSAADLFLSIHANASANAGVRGFETYFLNFAPNSEAEAIAARENAGSARRMGSLPDIVKAIALNNKIDESRDFASMVQASMHDLLRKTDRNARNLGVKQAPFMVLIGATMPSVLVEVSFLTNRDEATLLRSQNYRQQIAEALFAGVMKYGNSLKKPAVLRSGF